MTLVFWDSYDNHYKERETDEIEVDGKTKNRPSFGKALQGG